MIYIHLCRRKMTSFRTTVMRFAPRRKLLGVLPLGVLLLGVLLHLGVFHGIFVLRGIFIVSSPKPSKMQGYKASNSCAIPQYDPFDEAVAKFFNYKEIWPPCPKFQSPFIIRPPNLLMLNKSHSPNFPTSCVYKVVEGEKGEGEEERVADDPPVEFDPRLETVVNGSFIRVDCGKDETHFLH